ncbi:MAG: 50S ribosomal protein L1 [Armatimonadetes bacterium]|nr:50S ribosomal protein L1 [Armatimonadota bacterium]
MPKKARKNPNSKRFAEIAAKVDQNKEYDVEEAIKLVKEIASTKFDESIDLAIRLGVDPRKSDQNVRGITNLPHGTGKTVKVAVLAKGELAKEAEDAGADRVGDEDLIKAIQEGWKDFDIMLATNDMAPQIGKVGRFLGTKTPNKRNGTVTDSVASTVKDLKNATRVEYRIDKAGIVHMPMGRCSFDEAKLMENFNKALDAVIRAKPSSSKGKYLKSISMSSTMGPSLNIEANAASKGAGH